MRAGSAGSGPQPTGAHPWSHSGRRETSSAHDEQSSEEYRDSQYAPACCRPRFRPAGLSMDHSRKPSARRRAVGRNRKEADCMYREEPAG